MSHARNSRNAAWQTLSAGRHAGATYSHAVKSGVLAFPAGHGWHAATGPRSLNLPAGHCWQLVTPIGE